MKKNLKQAAGGTSVKKTRRGFNFIDFVLILLVLLIIVTAVNIISPMSIIKRLTADDTHTIEYTVEILGVDKEYIELIEANDAVVDSVSKYSLGRVAAVKNDTQYSVLEYSEAESAGVLAIYQDKYNLEVTITAECKYSEGEGYSVNGKRIAVGEKLYLRFPDFTAEGYCTDLSIDF